MVGLSKDSGYLIGAASESSAGEFVSGFIGEEQLQPTKPGGPKQSPSDVCCVGGWEAWQVQTAPVRNRCVDSRMRAGLLHCFDKCGRSLA